MSESEIAQIKETIAKEYMAAKWGLTAFAQDTTQHAFISARMKRIEEGRKALEAYVGDEALALVVETLESVPVKQIEEGCKVLEAYVGIEALEFVSEMIESAPEELTREDIQELLLRAFENTADTEYLINNLKSLWKSSDVLGAVFSIECAYKMVNAQPRLEGTA